MEIQNTELNGLTEDTSTFAGKVIFNTSATNDFLTNEAFKTLRSNLLFCGKDIKVILVTSTNENEGKSYISSELSKSLSELGKKVLLIDADMRKSVTLGRNSKKQNVLGLSEYLSGQATINQIIYRTQITGFDIVFCGRFPPNPVELLSTEVFGNLLENVKNQYDYIIIDSAPLLHVIDASVISVKCDGAIFVVSPGKTKYYDAINAKEQLLKSGCTILGAVLNNTNISKKYYAKSQKKKYYTH